ncbi:MAG: nucleotidyltransferase [Clostridia bacterium]|nr:nucleotidyltransferase [Clostridia bacterium]
MKTMAIVCEYNPFHNGHAYQISQHRTGYGVDCVIAVMSGNFVQRGAPAICDKWTRAEMALSGGCDLVLELPTVFATQSAERFAFGAVQLIDRLGLVDYLSFGSECGDIGILKQAACALLKPDFNEQVSVILKSGISYPAAREQAMSDFLGKEYGDLLSEPNNLLGIEYLKSLMLLNSKIEPVTLTRTVSHHAASNNENYCSASHLRTLTEQGKDISSFIPADSLAVLNNAIKTGKAPADISKLDSIITYLLRTKSEDELRMLPDVSEGIEKRFIEAAKSENTFISISESVKTKRYTKTRIDRTLIHMLLGINKDIANSTPEYFRVLAANSVGTAFLKTIKKNDYPVITKTANAIFTSKNAEDMFNIDCRATDIYAMLYPDNKYNYAGLDFINSPIIKTSR